MFSALCLDAESNEDVGRAEVPQASSSTDKTAASKPGWCSFSPSILNGTCGYIKQCSFFILHGELHFWFIYIPASLSGYTLFGGQDESITTIKLMRKQYRPDFCHCMMIIYSNVLVICSNLPRFLSPSCLCPVFYSKQKGLLRNLGAQC